MQYSSIVFEIPKQKELLYERFKSHKTLFDRKVLSGVLDIFDKVAEYGDEAVKAFTQEYDQIELEQLLLSQGEADAYVAALSPSLRAAIEQAIENVRAVNVELLPKTWERQIRPGTVIGEHVSALDSVGIWIPARKGPLLSTAIMLVTAAKVAGVKQIVVGMPPSSDGSGDVGTIAAARLAGADQFVIGNGVAIIAAFAQGTASISEVDGIYGPGPGGIAAAMSVAMTYGKRSVLGIGPTESMIFADASVNPLQLAYDLINEAEHGPDSSSILVTTSEELAVEVEQQLWRLVERVDDKRQQYLKQVFSPSGKGAIVVADCIETACELINWVAPEHLMIAAKPATESDVLARIRHAGEILLGTYTPFSAANYGIGITAVLPTNHYAKAFSGITCKDMVKHSTIGRLSKEALQQLNPLIQEMSSYEQLPCHGKAAQIRLNDLLTNQ